MVVKEVKQDLFNQKRSRLDLSLFMRYSSIARFEAYTNNTMLQNKSALIDIVFINAFILKSFIVCFNLCQDTSFEFLVILDELLLDIFKESGEQFMDVQHLEKEVLDRTGCDFNTLHDIVKETELGSLGVEDFILNDSKFFELEDSMVCPNFHFSPHKPGEGIDLDLSRCHISSCRDFVDTCLMARNARSIVLANCTIGNETWPFGVLDLLLWFCPLLEEVDLTGCECLRRSNFIKSPRHCRVIDYLNPSYILNSNNAVEKIGDMLSHDDSSFSLHSNGWTLLHSAVLLGSQELVKSCFAHYEFIGDNIYLKSAHFQTSLELAIALHRCDILELFKEKTHHFDNTTPPLFLELCFLPQHGIRAFDHPVEILTSNKDTLRITRNLHAIQDCSLTRLFQICLWELDIDFKKEILETLMRHLEEFTGPDSHPAIPCWNDKEVCEAVKILFKETGCSVNGKVEGFPYLMLSMPNVQLVEFFIQEGVQVDEKDQQGHTCLFHAVEKATGSDSPESWYMFITFLLQNKANPNERDNLSETPLLYSLSFRRSLCYFNSSGWPDVPYQAYGDDSGTRVVKIWRLLLEAKARPNVKDEKDRSLLHVLLSLLQTGCLRLSEGLEIVCNGISILQEYGLEINSRDTKGNTALHMWASLMCAAISDETIKIGSEIVSHGGAVNSRNDKGDTPFHLLMKEPFLRDDLVEPDLWSRILALGMNPWIANCDGKCPFEVLLENKHFGSAFTLLKAIFEDDQNRDKAESARRYRNQSGDYLLHMLCIVNNESVLEICDYLLGHGCEVNAQNECRQTPLHLLCNKVSETDSSLSQQTINFIRLLERHNADMTLSDSYGNTCKDMLSKFQNFKTRKEMKWISESIAHEAKLSDVVLGKNSQQVENYHYHTESIGEGTFSCVFPAIDERDGREVALKRLEKARLANKGNMLEREVKCLLKSSSCPSVVNYIACTRDSNFEYIVVELMEDSLDNYLSSTKECSQASTICIQISLGMEFLHQNNVLHRDLKPQNILYRTKPHFIVKISDFGLSKFLQQTSDGSKSVMHSKAGTRCWMAPELLAQNHEGHSKATDIFSCGLLFHYVMSRKMHPFSHSRKSLKSNLHEIEENIQRGKKHLCSSLSSEASHLITKMLSKVPERRPAASSLLNFPFFWDDRKKVSFLNSVGNQKEFEVPRSLRLSCDLSKVERDLEKCFSGHFCATADWANQIKDVYRWARRNYNTTSGVELVRFIRNSHFHAYDFPEKIRKDLLEKFVVLKRFPYLVTDLYEVIKHHSSWTNREDLMHFFKN